MDRAFQRADGVVQVGGLRVEEGLALARRHELVERGEVDGAERVHLAADAVDLGLQAVQLDAAVLDAPAERLAIDLGGVELLQVLRAAELRGLLLELQLGEPVAQRLQAALELEALLVGAAQARDRSSYSVRVTPSAASRSRAWRARPAARPARPGR